MKILVIEDEPPIRDTLRDILELTGYEVIVAEDGVDGIKQLGEGPDLILCDLSMPRLDGFDVLAAVRSDQTLCSTPFIVLSARTERSDLLRAMELGADDYITKPFAFKDVLLTIEARLQSAKSFEIRLVE